mmetsp:Transcript_82143/g.255294  ORF Transcript_82143/g.255294 Transcript_82143/m.255294 type:complete len:662 (-) Transcript_82143:75-2060(-)
MAQQQQCSGMAGAMAAALLLLLLPGLRAEAADAGGLAPAVYAEVASRTCTYDRKIENGGVTWRGWWAPQMKVDADCTAFDIASWGYHFGDAGARAFATALVQVPELVVREVRLPQNRMSDLGAEALAWALVNRSRCNLAVLDLQGNDFGEPPVALISTLGRCPGLRALNLSSTRLSNGSVQALLTLLPRAPATGLAALALSGNRLGDAGAAAVAKALVSFPMLEELRLANNNISAEGLGALASALSVAPRLATLDLSAVKAGAPEERGALAAADAEALAAALKALPELRDLSLDGRGLGDAGARSLAEGLRGAGKLTSLSLQMNGIGDAGSEALAEALAGTPRLARLELSANRIGTAGAKALAAALRRTPELEELFLGGSGNALGEAGAKELVGALGGMPRLATLRLQSPGLGGAVRELAGAVAARAPALRTLGLETDRLSNAAAEALATAAAVPLGLELLETRVVRLHAYGAKNGFQVGDVIVDIAGCPVSTFEEIWERIQVERERPPVRFTVERHGSLPEDVQYAFARRGRGARSPAAVAAAPASELRNAAAVEPGQLRGGWMAPAVLEAWAPPETSSKPQPSASPRTEETEEDEKQPPKATKAKIPIRNKSRFEEAFGDPKRDKLQEVIDKHNNKGKNLEEVRWVRDAWGRSVVKITS